MKKRNVYVWGMRILMWLAAGITAALTLFLLGYVLVKGLPNISWELLSTKPSYLTERIGILPDILNTLYIVLATLVIVLPLGVGAAIYLTEYAKNKKLPKGSFYYFTSSYKAFTVASTNAPILETDFSWGKPEAS